MALGIDLGTTNSAVAYVEHRQVHLLRDSSGQALVPSVVSFTPVRGLVALGCAAIRMCCVTRRLHAPLLQQ